MAQHAQLRDRHRPAGLLLRPAEPLAARHQREHQRAAAPVLPQGHRPRPPQPPTTSPRSPPRSTAARARRSAGAPRPRPSTSTSRLPLPTDRQPATPQPNSALGRPRQAAAARARLSPLRPALRRASATTAATPLNRQSRRAFSEPVDLSVSKSSAQAHAVATTPRVLMGARASTRRPRPARSSARPRRPSGPGVIHDGFDRAPSPGSGRGLAANGRVGASRWLPALGAARGAPKPA